MEHTARFRARSTEPGVGMRTSSAVRGTRTREHKLRTAVRLSPVAGFAGRRSSKPRPARLSGHRERRAVGLCGRTQDRVHRAIGLQQAERSGRLHPRPSTTHVVSPVSPVSSERYCPASPACGSNETVPASSGRGDTPSTVILTSYSAGAVNTSGYRTVSPRGSVTDACRRRWGRGAPRSSPSSVRSVSGTFTARMPSVWGRSSELANPRLPAEGKPSLRVESGICPLEPL